MKKVRIGGLEFKEYAAKKPLTITPTGEFATASELAQAPTLALGSLYSLSDDLKVKLTLERNQLEPDFKLGIFGVGIVTKDELLRHVEARTELGQEVVQAEMTYCNDLLGTLAAGFLPPMPEAPRPSVPPLPPMPEIPKPKPEPIPNDWKWIPKDWWEKWRPRFQCFALFCENTTDAVTQYAAAYRKKHVHPVFKARGD